jgi:hypothetical protein
MRAGCNIGRGIGHFEEDDDLPAWLALESATMFFHGLIAGWAPRCHWVMRTPETANSFNRAEGTIENDRRSRVVATAKFIQAQARTRSPPLRRNFPCIFRAASSHAGRPTSPEMQMPRRDGAGFTSAKRSRRPFDHVAVTTAVHLDVQSPKDAGCNACRNKSLHVEILATPKMDEERSGQLRRPSEGPWARLLSARP